MARPRRVEATIPVDVEDESTEAEVVSINEPFIDTLKNEIASLRREHGHKTDSDAFVHWAALQICPRVEPGLIASGMLAHGPGDKKIDGAWKDKASSLFYVAQGKYTENIEAGPTFGAGVAAELKAAHSWLSGTRTGGSPSRLEVARRQYDNAVGEGLPIRFALSWLANQRLTFKIK